MILKPAIEPWCQYSILHKTASISSVTGREHEAGVENGNHTWRDLLGKISLGSSAG
jgi:hypothetical protein